VSVVGKRGKKSNQRGVSSLVGGAFRVNEEVPH
jgi:hypothetical protein